MERQALQHGEVVVCGFTEELWIQNLYHVSYKCKKSVSTAVLRITSQTISCDRRNFFAINGNFFFLIDASLFGVFSIRNFNLHNFRVIGYAPNDASEA